MLFQWTPKIAMAMKQIDFTGDEHMAQFERYPEFFDQRSSSFGGFPFNLLPRKIFSDSPEERQKMYQGLRVNGNC
jgi:hypothetical protein